MLQQRREGPFGALGWLSARCRSCFSSSRGRLSPRVAHLAHFLPYLACSPQAEIDLGYGDSADLLTNSQLQLLLHPANPGLPYLYDKINTWGNCNEWAFEV